MLRYILNIYFLLVLPLAVQCTRTYSHSQKIKLREEVREMFQHAYEGYLRYASNYDELRPLTCDGVNTWGSYSLTLIDALDTLAVMGNYTEFRRVANLIVNKMNFDNDINVSVFETNIRIVGGLLSAHLLSHKAGMDLEPGWPCNGPLLRLAEDVARRLLPAFDSKTGMPYGTVNLRHGVPPGETSVTCTAGVGTFIVEFGALSRLTGDPIYEEVALNAIYSLWDHRSQIGLLGNHIDVQTGRWIAQDAGIGAGVDSFFEYLVKGAIMLNRPDLLEIFHEGRNKIDKFMKRDDWYVWVGMNKGQVTLPVFQSLEAYWPGVLSLIGDIDLAMKTMFNYHTVWRQYGFLPEFYNIPGAEAGANRESYPLRPELAESAMYLYRSTKNPYLLEVGEDMLRSIAHSAKTSCGYATIRNVRDHRRDNRMESFFLSETTKYLYLLFDDDNFLHNSGGSGHLLDTPSGTCIIEAGGYIFNTEAHPIDPSALQCCHYLPRGDLFVNFNLADYNGDEILRKERKRRDGEIEKSKKYACPDAKIPDDSKKMDLNLSIDIEVIDDKETGFDIAKEMLHNFQKIRNEDLDRRQAKAFKITDVLQAINNVNIVDEMPTVLLDFMKNRTADSQKVKTLFQTQANSSLALYIGIDTNKPRTIWTLYLEVRRWQANVEVIDKLGINKFDRNQNETHEILVEILALLDGYTYPEEGATVSNILQVVLNAQRGYIAKMTNVTAMLDFTLLFADDDIENLDDHHLDELIEIKKMIASIPSPSVPPLTTVDLDLFDNLHKVVGLKKRIIDTFQKLQTLMKNNDQIDSSNPQIQIESLEPNENTITKPSVKMDGSVPKTETSVVDTIFKQKSQLTSADHQSHQSTNSSILTELVHTIIKSTLPPKPKFDEQAFLKTIRTHGVYMNQTQKYELLTCAAPKFADRFSFRYEVI